VKVLVCCLFICLFLSWVLQINRELVLGVEYIYILKDL
jgi:hypothetical protein